MVKKLIAELIGTAVLVTFGCGVAVTCDSYVGIALAFGLVIVAMAYSIGNVSGCHVNPAVSTAMLINKKLTIGEFCGYVIAQFVGATLGALALYAMFTGGADYLGTHGMGTNGFGELSATGINAAGAFISEMVLTFVFVLAICGVTSKKEFSNIAGVVIGLTLTLVHLLGLPLTGTSVNPARSFGAAFVSMIFDCKNGAEAFSQLWVFIIAPLVGAVLAAFSYNLLSTGTLLPAAEEAGSAAAPEKKAETKKTETKKSTKSKSKK